LQLNSKRPVPTSDAYIGCTKSLHALLTIAEYQALAAAHFHGVNSSRQRGAAGSANGALMSPAFTATLKSHTEF
jgi:hypothetical protein